MLGTQPILYSKTHIYQVGETIGNRILPIVLPWPKRLRRRLSQQEFKQSVNRCLQGCGYEPVDENEKREAIHL